MAKQPSDDLDPERLHALHAAFVEKLRCSFCGAKASMDAKLIPGPKANICFPCVPRVRTRGESLVAQGRGGVQRRPTGEELPCSFCDKAGVAWLVIEGDARICDECIRLCEGVIAEEQEHRGA